jgi:hypothetical protein
LSIVVYESKEQAELVAGIERYLRDALGADIERAIPLRFLTRVYNRRIERVFGGRSAVDVLSADSRFFVYFHEDSGSRWVGLRAALSELVDPNDPDLSEARVIAAMCDGLVRPRKKLSRF